MERLFPHTLSPVRDLPRRAEAWRFSQATAHDAALPGPDRAALEAAWTLTRTDPSAAIPVIADLADNGSVWGMNYLGWAYATGAGVEPDPIRAEDWYRRALACGSRQAQLRLGRHLASRDDWPACEAIYAPGVAAQWPPACYRLAMVKLRQPNSQGRREAARLLLEDAASGGDYGAEIELQGLKALGRFGWRHVIPGCRRLYRAMDRLDGWTAAQPDAQSATSRTEAGSRADLAT